MYYNISYSNKIKYIIYYNKLQMAGRCDSDPNKCRSQIELNRLFKDPVLGPFLKSRSINSEDNSEEKF